MKVALIPCGSTEWHDEGRLLGRVEIPLSEAGQDQCRQWSAQLHDLNLRRIVHAPDELATQTARVLARVLSVPTKAVDDLVEVDLGLWAGLTESQLKSRFATAHRELRESPLNVNPPGGESIESAMARLETFLRKQIRRNGKTAIGVVVRPFLFALARQTLGQETDGGLLETARTANGPVIIDFELTKTPESTA
jgi:broad specificity phosphatase PhoE